MFAYIALTIGSISIGASVFIVCKHFGFSEDEAWAVAYAAGFGVVSNMVAFKFMIENLAFKLMIENSRLKS